MAETEKLQSTEGAWTDVAIGEGDVTLSVPSAAGVRWAITEDTSPPAFEQGHPLRPLETTSMRLADGERLWLRGRGTVIVTAAVPA
jgi:hypothetical protein